jgi:uncharacterized protein (DUF58 family)
LQQSLPEIFNRIRNLSVRARRVVEGFLVGEHISPFRGGSVEFAQHRAYAPGDEIRYIDWRLLARTDHYHIKQFDVTTNLRAYLLVDSSGSMAYPEPETLKTANASFRPTKYEYASLLAAAFSYLLLHQSDAVSLCTNEPGGIEFLPPRTRATYLHQISNALEKLTPAGPSGILELIQYIQDRVNQRSMCLLISDFLVDLNELIAKVKTLRHHGHDLILVQVLDPDEVNFPFNRFYRFESMEDKEYLSADAKKIREQYLEAYQEHQNKLRRALQRLGMDFHSVLTTSPPEKVIGQILNSPTRSKKLKALV